nr:MAG TPA: hypothetical protein [Caudoviricetes sp.]DAH95947.1 MAG TPA: hypothetical protein [Caudoviricetes sp.]
MVSLDSSGFHVGHSVKSFDDSTRIGGAGAIPK